MKLPRETQRLLQEAGALIINGRLYVATPPEPSEPEPIAAPKTETAPDTKEGE